MNEAEEFYGENYNAYLNQIAEENEKRNEEVLKLKCNLLKPIIGTKTLLSAHIKTLEEDLKNTPYENIRLYEEIIDVLKMMQVA